MCVCVCVWVGGCEKHVFVSFFNIYGQIKRVCEKERVKAKADTREERLHQWVLFCASVCVCVCVCVCVGEKHVFVPFFNISRQIKVVCAHTCVSIMNLLMPLFSRPVAESCWIMFQVGKKRTQRVSSHLDQTHMNTHPEEGFNPNSNNNR